MTAEATVERLEEFLKRNPGTYQCTEDGRVINVAIAIEHYIRFLREPFVTLAQVAYDAYCDNTGGVSLISGAKLPSWSELKPEIQEAWKAAATAVRMSH